MKYFSTNSDYKKDYQLPEVQLLDTVLNFNNNTPKIKDNIIVKSYKETGALSEFVKEKLESQNMDPRNNPRNYP